MKNIFLLVSILIVLASTTGCNNGLDRNTILVIGISLDQLDFSIFLNDTYQLNATITPTNATNKKCSWLSSDNSIATVSDNGLITTIATGQTTITVASNDQGFSASCEVSVLGNEEDFILDPIILSDGDNDDIDFSDMMSDLLEIDLTDFLIPVPLDGDIDVIDLSDIPDNNIITVGDFVFRGNSEELRLIEYIGEDSGAVLIPSEVNGVPVTSIGDEAFIYYFGLTNIAIPNSVTFIGEMAFFQCINLVSINLPEGITSIGNLAFALCSSLTSMTIPDGVTTISDGMFASCSSLTSIIIPEGVTSIGGVAFGGCSSLTSITIPEGVPSIGDFTFKNCYSLIIINIPDSVTSIGDFAFDYCSSLETLNMYPLSSPVIYPDYFRFSLSGVTLHIKPEAIGYDVPPWSDTAIFSAVIRDL